MTNDEFLANYVTLPKIGWNARIRRGGKILVRKPKGKQYVFNPFTAVVAGLYSYDTIDTKRAIEKLGGISAELFSAADGKTSSPEARETCLELYRKLCKPFGLKPRTT